MGVEYYRIKRNLEKISYVTQRSVVHIIYTHFIKHVYCEEIDVGNQNKTKDNFDMKISASNHL